MNDRRRINVSNTEQAERRLCQTDRRHHKGLFRWFWTPMPDFWSMFRD